MRQIFHKEVQVLAEHLPYYANCALLAYMIRMTIQYGRMGLSHKTMPMLLMVDSVGNGVNLTVCQATASQGERLGFHTFGPSLSAVYVGSRDIVTSHLQ